jgi:hypothetical protein
MGVRIYATHAEYGSASVRIAVVSLDRLVVSENGTPANSAEDAAGGPTPGATLYVPAVRRGDLRLDLALHMTPDVLNFDGARRWRLDSAAGGSPAHWAPLAGDFGDATRRMARFHLPSGATPVPAADRDTVLSAWLDRNGNGSIDGGEPSCQVAVTLVDIVNVTATSTTDPSRTANGTDAAPGELYLPFSTGNSVTTASVFALSSCVVGGVSQWPAGRPAWSLSVATGGPSMALGNWGPDGGSYTFPSPGAYTFTAECGNAVEMTVNVVKVDVVGHKPGTIQSPGAAIAEADETDPAKLVTLVNEDIDEKDDLTALPDVPDNANTTIGSADDDIVKVVLKGPMPSLSSGTIGFSVDPPGSLRIRNAAGTAEVPASDLTVNLAAPAGCLAGLASGDEVTVLLEGLNPAANAVARLEYKRGTDVVASDEAHLTVMRMAFDHAQVNARNLVHADDDWKEFRHCLGVEWVAAKALDMAPLLTADSQAFLGMAEWRISGSSGTSVLSYGNIPGLHDVLRYRVEVRVKDGGPVADRLIVVVFPPATRQAFDAWVTANQDTTWMDALPAAYQALGTDNSDPEPPGQPTSCDPQRWDAPDSLSSYYHPGAAFEMRSIPEASRAGHQACYDGNGDLITIGVSAGSADRVGPDADASDHRDADVLPFIWAAQLDGNPVEPNWVLAPTNLDRPMIHEGTRIGQYLNLRRPIPNAKPLLAPGACSP